VSGGEISRGTPSHSLRVLECKELRKFEVLKCVVYLARRDATEEGKAFRPRTDSTDAERRGLSRILDHQSDDAPVGGNDRSAAGHPTGSMTESVIACSSVQTWSWSISLLPGAAPTGTDTVGGKLILLPTVYLVGRLDDRRSELTRLHSGVAVVADVHLGRLVDTADVDATIRKLHSGGLNLHDVVVATAVDATRFPEQHSV